MTQPVLTVITPVFNGRNYIAACLQNFVDQNCADAVHLVMDGGSTDGTADYVREQMPHMPWLHLVSEPDKGQSDAMNKGIALAPSEYVSFLNVDDFYEPGTLNRVVPRIRALDRPTMIVGNCNVRDENDRVDFVNTPALLDIEHLAMGYQMCDFPCNPSAYFYPKSVHEKIGPYRTDEHFLLDIYFVFDAVRALPTQYHDELWGNFRNIPGSKTFEHQKAGLQAPALHKFYRQLFWSLPPRTQIRVLARYTAWTAAKKIRRLRGI
jgi:glycosyltransferase involved in cell wall biosynthesis